MERSQHRLQDMGHQTFDPPGHLSKPWQRSCWMPLPEAISMHGVNGDPSLAHSCPGDHVQRWLVVQTSPFTPHAAMLVNRPCPWGPGEWFHPEGHWPYNKQRSILLPSFPEMCLYIHIQMMPGLSTDSDPTLTWVLSSFNEAPWAALGSWTSFQSEDN